MNTYNTDSIATRKSLLLPTNKLTGIIQRVKPYGSIVGAPAASDFADQLVQPADYKEEIVFAHENKVFPYYHQKNGWGGNSYKWNQNGLNYCWAFGASAAMMDRETREGSFKALLAPTSLGFLVNWRNAGNYLASVITGVLERGICEASFRKSEFALGESNFKEGWKENALQHRMKQGGIWDVDYSNAKSTIQHCITGLTRGFSVYVAYNWWGHALEIVAVQWDETLPNNLQWWLRNSHNEDDTIILTGSKAIPDEAYIFRA